MSIHFHPLQVKEIIKETPDCISVSFAIPPTLLETFRYKAGQNLTLRTTLGNEELRRTYSLCSSPLDNEWKVAIKKANGGLFSTWANEQLKAGDTLDVMEPAGSFFAEPDPAQKKNYLAFAAGSGITPVISILKTILNAEPQSQFTLVYGSRNKNSIIFFEELEALKNEFTDRFNLVFIMSREKTEAPVHSGRIDDKKLRELNALIPYTVMDEFFLCGPEEMIFTIKKFLIDRGIPEKRIHFELFNTTSVKRPARPINPDNKPVSGTLSIKLDERSFVLETDQIHQHTVLELGLQNGLDLPFACKGGMCCSCKALLTEGKVNMEVHWGLEEEEIKRGYILCCQSYPLTEKLAVDFDIK